MKLYWRVKKGSKWTWRPATLTPSGKVVSYQIKGEEE